MKKKATSDVAFVLPASIDIYTVISNKTNTKIYTFSIEFEFVASW